MALVHSSYLPGDSCVPPRPHSFVTHVLVYPHLSTVTAAAAWDSPQWQTQQIDKYAPQLVERMDRVPQGSRVHDQAVTDFLSGADDAAARTLTAGLPSGRSDSNTEMRRRGLRATLHGFLRTFEVGAARSRVCIMAEPGTVALLVYAVARLLPPAYAETFWFSTYEPPQTSLRENRVARLIGGFTTQPVNRVETDALRRGISGGHAPLAPELRAGPRTRTVGLAARNAPGPGCRGRLVGR